MLIIDKVGCVKNYLEKGLYDFYIFCFLGNIYGNVV